MEEIVYDIIGIGIGPFNLGLAALCQGIPELNCLFIEQNESFNWHPGLMLSWTRLQVPFYADLVTMADPCSPFSYMAYLKAKKKMFRFAICENYFIRRTEYNKYCRWVVSQLTNLKYNCRCTEVHFNEGAGYYRLKTDHQIYMAKHIVIGIGSIPFVPSFAKKIHHSFLLHSSQYLSTKKRLLEKNKIALIGSGQSAAEIFYDLLQTYPGELRWFTRSASFYPMDYTKFALEKSSPDYIDHFFALKPETKSQILAGQDNLYKGINTTLINDIYELLDEKEPSNVSLHPNCEWKSITEELKLSFFHLELQQSFTK